MAPLRKIRRRRLGSTAGGLAGATSFKAVDARLLGRPRPLPAVPRVSTAPGGTAPATTTSPPIDPYADYPWARTLLNSITRQGQEHQAYVTDKVQPWVKGVTEGLSGYADTAMQRYLGQLNLAVGAAGAAVSGAQMPNVQSSSGGGMVGDPNAYATQAQGQYGQAMGSTFRDIAAHQAALGGMQPATLSQGIVQSIGQYAAGLPSTYADKRAEQESRIGEFIAEMQDRKAQQAEQTRQWAIGRTDAERERRFSRGMEAANLGLDAAKLGMSETPGGYAPGTPAPSGYVAVPRLDGGVDFKPDKTFVGPGAAPTKGTYTPNELKKQGFHPLPKGAGGKWKDIATQADDGTLWIKGSGAATPKSPKAEKFIAGLQNLWDGKHDSIGGVTRPGWGTSPRPQAIRNLAQWALTVAPQFRTAKGVDWDAITRIIDLAVGQDEGDEMLDYFRSSKTGPYATKAKK